MEAKRGNMAEVICGTRKQAIEDGVLVDVSDMAKQAGIIDPVALTRVVWTGCIAASSVVGGPTEARRLSHLLLYLALTIAKARGSDPLHFEIVERQGSTAFKTIELKAVLDDGDDGEQVITVMYPDED